MKTERSQLLRKLIQGEELSMSEASVLGDVSNIDESFPIKHVIRGDNYLGSEEYSDKEKGRKNIAPICSTKENLVAKTRNCEGCFRDLNEEYGKIEYGVDQGVPLVDSKGFFNVYNVQEKRFVKAMILDEIQGETLRSLKVKRDKNYPRAKKLWKRALEKAGRFFFLEDYMSEDYNGEWNVLFEYSTQKVHLIDPEFLIIRDLEVRESVEKRARRDSLDSSNSEDYSEFDFSQDFDWRHPFQEPFEDERPRHQINLEEDYRKLK